MYRKEKQQEEMVKQEETIGSRLLADIIVVRAPIDWSRPVSYD